MSDNGHLVVRRDMDNRLPIAVGDPVTTYTLGEPFPYADTDMPAHSGCDLENWAYEVSVLHLEGEAENWRVKSELYCHCRARRVIAQLLFHLPSERLWGVMKPESVPREHRTKQADKNPGWALHGNYGERPHIGGVVSCKGCHTRWVVVSFPDRLEQYRIIAATHGAHVAP